KQYGTPMRQTKNLMGINIDALYNILKQNQGDVNDALGYKKKVVVINSDQLALVAEKTNFANKKQEFGKTDDKKVEKKADEKKRDLSKVKCYNCKKEGYFAKDCKKVKDQAWMESSSDSDQEINANMIFMAQIEKVLFESDKSSSSAEETIAENADLLAQTKVLKDQLQVKHVVIDTHVECHEKYAKLEEERYKYMIRYSALFDNDKQHRKLIADQEVLFDKMSVKLVELDKHQTSLLKPYVSNVILEKIIIDLEDEVVSLLEKEKENLKTIESLKSNGFESSENTISESENQSENDCLEVAKNVTKWRIQSVRRPKHSNVIWKKKGSSNTSNVDLSAVSLSKLNKNVKRYSRNNLLSYNNSHLKRTSSVYVCNDAMNVSCNSRMCDLLDDNNFCIFDDKSVRISPVNKMPFRKKPHDYMNFLGTVRFGNNDFAVIAGYGDVFIVSMTIKKVYYVEGLGHNLFSLGQFCDKGLEVAFRNSTCFVRNEDGVDLLTGDRSSNLYTIALNEVVSNFSNCLLTKASSLQSWLWHQRLSHLNFATINNLVKNNLVQDEASDVIIYFIKKTQMNLQLQVQRVRTNNGTKFKNKTLAKFFDEFGITQQFSAARTPQQNGADAITTAWFTQNRSIIYKRFDKTPYELINKRKPNIKFFHVFGCRCYLFNDYEDVGMLKAKRDIGVFVGYSKESAAFKIYNKQTRKIHESMNIMKSSTTNVETSINEEVFHQVSESFQRESSSSSLNDDVQQSPEELILPQTNTQSISNNMIPNVDEASTSHNVFNERLEDAYFDASTLFHDPSNVHTYYQPYPHEKKCTKDHSLHKIIGDPKLSVCTRGQLANSCLFSCLLSSIEPTNVVEALRDADWVSAMQEELDQFARLKVWRLVPRPKGKSVIKTKWIFKNKKDESSLVIRNKARLVAVGY
nr:hypothetical protein [Tanacetum cinerariifolium]